MKAIAIIIITILGFAVYANSLNGEFIWDDIYLIRDNPYIKSFSFIKNIFTEDIRGGTGLKSASYRPFQMFTYMTNYSLCKLDVRVYHLTNVLLHILVAIGIFYLVNILYDDRLLSLFTSALFVIHPIHTEAVSYISGRSDSLASFFMLLSFILYIKVLDRKAISLYILMLLSYILALLSRESCLIFPALLLLYHYTFKKKIETRGFFSISSIAFIYFLLRVTTLRTFLPHYACTSTFFQRFPGFFAAIMEYIRLLILPLSLHMEYGEPTFLFSNPKVIIGILLLSALLIYAFKKRDINRLIFFSISWFFITLLPQSNLYPIQAYMAEHWLYLPSIGFFLLLAGGLSYLHKKNLKAVVIVFFASFLTFYSYLTVKQNNYWKKPIAFYNRTLEFCPQSARVHNDLGVTYFNVGKRKEAMDLFKRAIELKSDYTEAYNNLGAAYYITKDYEKAVTAFKKAIELNPDYAAAYNNLGVAYKDAGKLKEAMASYEKAIELNPAFADTYYNLGNLYAVMGKKEKAVASYKKTLRIDPDYTKARNKLKSLEP